MPDFLPSGPGGGGGGGAVSSVFSRTGAVVAAASDYDASQIDNDSGVSGATVAAALDTLAGRAIVIPSIGGLDSSTMLDDGRYWTLNSDPSAGATAFSLGLFAAPAMGAEQYDPRYYCGTRNGAGAAGGGICFLTESAFNPITPAFSVRTDLGNDRTVGATNRYFVGKWVFFIVTCSVSAGTMTVRFYLQGTVANEGTVLGNSIAAGGDFCIGTSAEAAVAGGDGFNEGFINGVGYVNRALTYAEASQWTDAVFQAGQFVDIPSGGSLTAGWRVPTTGAPGATWSPFVGTGDLTRVGTAPGFRNSRLIIA